MPEEPTATETEEQPIPSAPEGERNQAQPKAGAEPPPETDETPETDEAADKLWDETLPELAGTRGQLTPDARERLLAKRLAAQLQSKPTTGADATGPAPTEAADAGALPVAEIPAIDAKAQREAIGKAFEDGDSGALADILDQHRAYVDGMGKLVYQAVQEQKTAIGDLGTGLKELRIPTQLKAALPNVKEATDADLVAASELLASGEVKKPETALKVAAFNRQSELAAAKGPKASASEEAKRKAAGIAASRVGAASSRAGEVVRQRIPTSQQDMEDLLQADADAQKK